MGVYRCRCRCRCTHTPTGTPTPVILGVTMPDNSRYIRFADSILFSQAMLRNSIFVKDSINLLVDLVFRDFFSWWTAAKISMRAYIFLLSLWNIKHCRFGHLLNSEVVDNKVFVSFWS